MKDSRRLEQFETLTQDEQMHYICQILLKPSEQRKLQQLKLVQQIFESKISYIQQLKDRINEENMLKLVNSLSIEIYQPFEVVFNQGEIGRKMYFILTGEVGILIKLFEKEESPLKEGKRKKIRSFEDIISLNYSNFRIVASKQRYDHFGEIAIEQRIPRTATVITKQPCVFATLTIDSYQKLLQDLLEEAVQLRQKIIASYYPFTHLRNCALQQLLHGAEEMVFSQSVILFKRGFPIDAIYIVISGEVLVQCWMDIQDEPGITQPMKVNQKLVQLGLMGKGSIIGDVEFFYARVLGIRHVKRISQVIVQQSTKLVKIQMQTFKNIITHQMTNCMFDEFLHNKYSQKIQQQIKLQRYINNSKQINKMNFSPNTEIKISLFKDNTIRSRGNSRTQTQSNEPKSNSNEVSPSKQRFERARSTLEEKVKQQLLLQNQKKMERTMKFKSTDRMRIKTEVSNTENNYKSSQSSQKDSYFFRNNSIIINDIRNRVRNSKTFIQVNDNGYLSISKRFSRLRSENKN